MFRSEKKPKKKCQRLLGVIFASKLNWNAHVASAICKARKSLFALWLLRRFFNDQEMRLLLDSNFYSILYYNAVLWLTPELSSNMKQALISISANALRSCMMSYSSGISFITIHSLCKKYTPIQLMSYHLSLHLHKTLTELDRYCTTEHAALLDNIICTRRQISFEIIKTNRSKIGMNSLSNKFYHITKLISLSNLNLDFVHFKK